MKIIRFAAALALAIGSTACTAERALGPQAAQSSVSQLAPSASQVPLLFVVDGVRYPKDQVPALSSEQISAVTILKGTAALRRYGNDAAYGVVIIKTKGAAQGS